MIIRIRTKWLQSGLLFALYLATAHADPTTISEHDPEAVGATSVVNLPRMQQADGLFHHGPGAPVYWGRGSGQAPLLWLATARLETEMMKFEEPQEVGK